MAASVDVIRQFDVTCVFVLASALGDSGRCRIHARRKRQDSLLKKDSHEVGLSMQSLNCIRRISRSSLHQQTIGRRSLLRVSS
jgi:hypothetical protein